MSSDSFAKYLRPSPTPPENPTPHSSESSGVPGEPTKLRCTSNDVTQLTPFLLEKKLLEEIAADERYALINDAKLRALKQGTNSYDEFRQIWMAAHLRPMAKEDKLDGFMNGRGSKVVWNSAMAGGGGGAKEEEELSGGALGAKEKPQLEPPSQATLIQRDVEAFNLEPKSSLELLRCWRKLETEEGKLEYLETLLQDSSNPLSVLWSEEIPSELFTEIIRLGHRFVVAGEGQRSSGSVAEKVTTLRKVIDIAVASKRISITTSFLDTPEKQMLSQILDTLEPQQP